MTRESLLNQIAKKEAELNELKEQLEIADKNYAYMQNMGGNPSTRNYYLDKMNKDGLALARKIQSREQTLAKLRSQLCNC